MKTVAKIFAVLAILGLVISSFAFVPFAGAQTLPNPAGVPILDRDLSVGMRGPEVQGMQGMLISFGFAIPAGATGYFGEQTRSALAAYQQSMGITPAVGYFGPKTRAAFAATTPLPLPVQDNDDESSEDEDDDSEDREDADEAIDAAKETRDDARSDIEEAEDDGDDLNDAEDYLEDAEEALDDAENAFDDEDYEEAKDRAEDSIELSERASDEIEGGDDNDDDGGNVETSARSQSTDGADNDVAAFGIEFDLEAFGDREFVSEDPSVSVDYRIERNDGTAVSGATLLSAALDSTADERDGYFILDEDEKERFELKVVFDPLSSDEGSLFRLQLLGIRYNDEAAAPDRTWSARPDNRYQTDSVYIGD